MIWRVGTSFLVGDGTYRLIDATGAIVATYEASSWEDGFDSDTTEFLVRDGQLIERVVKERLGWETSPFESESVVADGLIEDPSDEAARFVATVLGDHAVVEEERRGRREP